jgi:hypothetical protein
VAVGVFVGFVSTLILVGAAFALSEWIAPYSPGGELWSTARRETLIQESLFLLIAAAIAVIETSLFIWLRWRIPDFARGYRTGCLLVAGFTALFFLPNFFLYLFDR